MQARRILTCAILMVLGVALCHALEPWGLVKLSVAHVRSDAAHESEMVTQATMGTPLRLLDEKPEWLQVQLPDGYKGWISRWSVQQLSQDEFDDWRTSDRVIVTLPGRVTTSAVLSPDFEGVVTDIDRMDILEVVPVDSADTYFIYVRTPDGREGYVCKSDVEDLNLYYGRGINTVDADVVLGNARDMLGRVYLWGGTSYKMVDCSGLSRICYQMSGVLLPRDSGPQSRCGVAVSLDDAVPGDLVFFAGKSGRVNHVGIYMGDKRVIHSSGQVRINSLNPDAEDYIGYGYHSIRHIGNSDAEGVQGMGSHPWYFMIDE